MNDITDEEIKFLAFHLACRLEDYEKQLKKHKAGPGGPKPKEWEKE